MPHPEVVRSVSGGKTVLVTGARAPVALHLARLFDGAGWRVVLADTPAAPISAASRACSAYHRLPPPRFEPQRYADAVEDVLAREAVCLVLPTCEEVFYLAGLWREREPAARLFAPDIDLLQRVHNKFDFIGLCQELGLAVPRTVLLEDGAGLAALRQEASDLVFKPVWSRFASRVLIRPTPAQLDALSPSPRAPWVAQQFLGGEELSVYAVARQGQLVAFSLYRSVYRAGKGAGIYFQPVEDEGAKAFVARFVAGTRWTGQISFDLMRMADSSVLPLECNPRATSGLHFFRDPQAFVAALAGEGAFAARDVTHPQTVHLAMWLYGLPAALRAGRFGDFRRHLAAADDLLDWPGDAAPARAQWRALGEIAGLALRHRISLQRASTRDIEWDGPDQSSI